MTLYYVEVDLGTERTEVQAESAEDAVEQAMIGWIDDAANIIGSGTFSAREIEALS